MFWRNSSSCFFFFFNDTATTEIYTLSLHDALPISEWQHADLNYADELAKGHRRRSGSPAMTFCELVGDRKSTRLNSSHQIISYAVFCLKKKNIIGHHYPICHPSVIHARQTAVF